MADELDDLREWSLIIDDLAHRLEDARESIGLLAVDAWGDGASLRQIAAASGYSHLRVHQIVRAAMAAAADPA